MARRVLLVMALLIAPVHAAIDAYEFPNDELAVRYDNLIAELRCPNCLNTNIAGSDAMIAQDLRREVHRLLLEGKSDREILDFMQNRYGDFILYEPRLGTGTLLLWFGPFALLVVIALVFVSVVRSRSTETPALSEEEQARLDQLVQEQSRN